VECAPLAARISSSSLSWTAWLFTILGITLNQKNHQKCHDSRACVYDQLPRIAELEYRARDASDYDESTAAMMNVAGWSVTRAVHLAKQEKCDEE